MNLIRYIFACYCLSVVSPVFAQNADFTLSTTVCINEKTEISNLSTGSTGYLWDFCGLEFSSPPTETTIGTLSNITRVRGSGIIYDTVNTNYIFFATDDSRDDLNRIVLGDNLGTTFSHDKVAFSSGSLVDPHNIVITKNSDGSWLGFVGSSSSGVGIKRIEFGTSLVDDAGGLTITDLGTFGEGNVQMRGVQVWKEGNNYFLVALNLNGNRFVIVNYGDSFLNDPVNQLVTSSMPTNLANGFDLVKYNNEVLAYVVGLNGMNIVRVNFGSTIFSDFSIENTFDDSDFTTMLGRLSRISIVNNFGNYYAIVSQFDAGNPTFTLDLKDLNNVSTPEDLGYANTQFNDVGGGYYDGNYYFYGINGASLNRITFSSDCGVSINSSEIVEPSISYTTSGTNQISLKAVSASGDESFKSETVMVSTDVTPDIDFTIDLNQCISSPNSFLPSLSGLTYSWDFNNDGIEDSNLENPSFQLGLGDNLVRLDINDGTCNNFVEQIITIYPDPPTPTFTAPSNECKSTLISFTNTTDESQHIGVLSYEWDFNGEGTSTDPNPDFSFDSPGTKQIALKTIIPGCENISSVFEIEVSDGPTSSFNASSFSICETESISFTNQSTNNPISWEWDFDDGFSSNAQNPDHLFSEPGNYNVSLTVTDALGCQNTLAQEVSVSSLPEVTFDFDVPCTSSDGIQFMDLSTVSGADIVSRTWYVGDTPLAEAQDQQNPLLTFSSEGVVNVRLETVSSTGCESSHSEDIQILAAPQPDFSINIGCEGEMSSFSDITLSPGNQITSRLWTLDGATYTTEEIDHTFSGSGVFEVTLEVTGQNFCSETITKEVEVLELLTVDFNVDGDCSNELIELSDQSTELQDPIVSREWSLDGTSVGNGSNLTLASLPDNTYELMLEVTTASGCVVNTTENIVIDRAPQSVIASPKTFGIPGDAITFTNESTGGSSYHWLFNGDSVSNNALEETFQFPDPGNYQVSMVSDNDLGCSDTITTTIQIAIPNVDLSIGQFEVVENEGKGTIFLEIQNNSNLPIDDTEVVIELENQFAVTEQINSLIEIGESELVSLNVGVPLSSNELNYLCVSLNSQYNGFDDINPLDNEKCLTIEPNIVVEAPFPNPVTDQVRVRLVAPANGSTTITLINSAGKVEMVHSPQTQEGLNNFFLDLKALTTGVYFIRIELEGTTSVQRIIKL